MRGSVESDPRAAVERATKVQEVVVRAMAMKIRWWRAGEILALSRRQLRRLRQRCEEHGYEGLMDRRRGRRLVPRAAVGMALGLYRGRNFDLKVAHFHTKRTRERQIGLSDTWVIQALQEAGEPKRGAQRKRRERRPLPGRMLHIDGSRPLDSDCGSRFRQRPKAGGRVGAQRLTLVGRALRELAAAFTARPRKSREPIFSLQSARLVKRDNIVEFQNLTHGALRLGRHSSQDIRVEALTPDPAPKPAVEKTRAGKAEKTAFPTRLELVQHPRDSPSPPHRRRLGNL